MMQQKFRMFSFVRVADKLPESMNHFQKGFTGIIGGSYSQLYGGKDIKQYKIYITDGMKVINSSAWYDEEYLALIEYQDRDYAEELIEAYTLKLEPAIKIVQID